MGLRNLNLKASYCSEEDNLLLDFYVPVLSNSICYDRIAGYFCSNSLAIAAKGISNFIKNGGRIRLVANVVLSEEDQIAIKEALEKKEHEVLQEIEDIEDQLKKDHISMLGWLIKTNRMEIKIAVVERGIEHRKLGILKDNESYLISFSGSDNETIGGWLMNNEQFHVFCSWKDGEQDHLNHDLKRFDRIWNNLSSKAKVYTISDAFREGLIKTAPKNEMEFQNLCQKVSEDIVKRAKISSGKINKIDLREYQHQAVKNWLSKECRGIFEMATGTGKTFTALAAVEKVFQKDSSALVVITVPYGHLIRQWQREVEKFGLAADWVLIADSTNPTWKDELDNYLKDIYLKDIYLGYKKKIIVFTTHNTFSSQTFIDILTKNKKRTVYFVLADEVHGIGSPQRTKGLIEIFDYRLGLSATPKRWFDQDGTEAIFDFFGDVVFEFSLQKAINTVNPETKLTYLTPFEYHPIFINLTPAELERYIDLTYKLVKISASEDVKSSVYENILFQRSNIIKNANEKISKLDNLLDDISPLNQTLNQTIIYCSPQGEQLEKVMQVLTRKRIIAHRFTMEETLDQREDILAKFASGKYQVLAAMKCLDEGVDIPTAHTAILLASSSNPREYIQRIGRVIRRSPNKQYAKIYDMIVVPSQMPAELRQFENRIFQKESNRCKEIAKIAVNSVEAIKKLNSI